MEKSDYFTLIITIPETHADRMREAIGKAGGGDMGNYSHCSFSYRGIGRFKPKEGADPFIGQIGKLEEVFEEKIEVVCHKDRLENVVKAIKKAHPYEETTIDIFPIFKIGIKT